MKLTQNNIAIADNYLRIIANHMAHSSEERFSRLRSLRGELSSQKFRLACDLHNVTVQCEQLEQVMKTLVN